MDFLIVVNFRPSLTFYQQSLLAPTASKEEQELGHMKKNVTAHVIWRNFRHAIHNNNNKNDDASLIKIVSASTCGLGTNAFPVLKTLFFHFCDIWKNPVYHFPNFMSLEISHYILLSKVNHCECFNQYVFSFESSILLNFDSIM